ncbi:MAG: sialate O-acetylesterase [Verrucomicrobiota bacterium]
MKTNPTASPTVFAATLLVLCALSISNAENLKIFLLVGQSNMEGKGNPAHLDTYKEDPLIKPTYEGLKDGESWLIRDDVWITYPSKARGAKHGPLTVGYGTKGEDSIGPEFGFGHTVGNAIDEPVLLVKCAWGGRSLAVPFRPPGAPPSEEELEARLEKAKKKRSEVTVDDIKAEYGVAYRDTVRYLEEELAALDERFPKLRGHKPEIAGIVWHQGFNDIINRDLRENQYSDYTEWLITFIKDLRKDIGAPEAPFVIGELSTGGIPKRGDFQKAQASAAKPREFQGNVAFVPTAEYYDTKAQELFDKGFWKGTDEQKAQWQAVGNDRP